ncbi:MAG: GDSL-type esterase/lipase family protein [Candidatus Omnitrophica bacterium]|nr:GDSL-type esterase/lipase family protein [Candidatus Omnitrophota bacterium]
MTLLTVKVPGAESGADAGLKEEKSNVTVSMDNGNLVLAPYVWKRFGAGPDARVEATMPGAYFKMMFTGSATIGLMIDGTANNGCPRTSMPVIEYSLDEGSFKHVQLSQTGSVYSLPLAGGLASADRHRLVVYFRAADLAQNRWRSSICHLRLAGIELGSGGELLPCPALPKRAIGFGDSITEGVGVDGLFTSWQLLDVNNARATWFPIVCSALNCEYGQLGSGGQGMVRTLEMPPLTDTWDRYDATTSRLTDGRLLPEPDYVFCCMGTNDAQNDITMAYIRWLAAMRKACPQSWFFCVVPPLGWHGDEIAAAVAARRRAGDPRVCLIKTAPLQDGFRVGKGPTALAYDGVHPSVYGNALLGALIAVESQKTIARGE